MSILAIIFMVLVVLGLISLERRLQLQLKNDERIIARLDILINDLRKQRDENT
ncbi:DUF4083 domain-containing protein [Paenibacillus lupini]|nr:hypothetical protein [Paenibacillus lupini]